MTISDQARNNVDEGINWAAVTGMKLRIDVARVVQEDKLWSSSAAT
jgi:hypothetical protein